MSKRTFNSYYRKMKVVLAGVTTLSFLLLPSLAFADSTSSTSTITTTAPAQMLTEREKLQMAAGEIAVPGEATADYLKVKFTKEQAIAKVKELFPLLKNTEPNRVELGNSHTYPAPANQMIWNIEWSYQYGNNFHGFSSQVDAITGDLLNANIPTIINQDNEAYYPPKITRAQALVKAKAFIAKAASTTSIKDLKEDENYSTLSNKLPLFGPIQYGFYFSVTKNGIYSQNNYINVVIDGSGNVTQYSRPSNQLAYPSSTPVISQADAEKLFKDHLDVVVSYLPIYKNGVVLDWVLSWTPVDTGVSSIDAITGKMLNYDGKEVSSSPITYSEVPSTTETFKARTASDKLTAEDAAKLVQQVVKIKEGHTLIQQSLNNLYGEKREIWYLTWGAKDQFYNQGFPIQSSAEVDATTGEILSFRVDQYGVFTSKQEPTPTVPLGANKLTKEASKQKAIELVNRWYPNASGILKLVDHGEDWTLINEGTQYRYEFARFYQDTLVSNGSISITLDAYGELQSYYAYPGADIKKIGAKPAVKVTKEEALNAYRKQYQMKLQYSEFGGYYTNPPITPEIHLVYSPQITDMTLSNKTLDVQSGEWVTIYEGPLQEQGANVEPTDLTKHWAEKAIRTLVEYGVLTPDEKGKVKPNEVIKVGDWLTMMAKSMTTYYGSGYNNNESKPIAGVDKDNEYYNAVSYAVTRQWIKSDTPLATEEQLTREQLAVLLTSIVKYNKMSAYLSEDAALSKFSDAGAIKNRGAVAMVVKLGLMQGENGKFNPNQLVTKAQAATVIMKLVELQGKIDQRIGEQ